MKLSTEQLTALESHLRVKVGLQKADFIMEITDHYACALEELVPDQPWEEALKVLDEKFGGRKGLRKLEKEYIENAYRHFHQYHGKLIRRYLYKTPYCWYSLLLLVAYFGFGLTAPVLAYQVCIAMFLALFTVGVVSFLIGTYYWFKKRDNQYAYILRYHSLPALLQINMVNVLITFEGIENIWLTTPMACLAFWFLTVIPHALFSTFQQLRLKVTKIYPSG
jgi:hypothetical protein